MDISYEHDEIIKRLKLIIDQTLFDSNIFFDFISKYKICLSGSLLLQAITDEKYDNFDIDLFVLGDKNPELETEFKSLCVTIGNAVITFHELLIANNNYPALGLKSITECEGTFKIPELKSVQIIYIDENEFDNVGEYVKLFDLDICANYFDGVSLFIENLDHIINNEALLKNKNNNINFVETYKNRLITKRTEKRIVKYYRRGYKIKLFLNEYYDVYIANTNMYTNNAEQDNILSTSKKILIIYEKPDGLIGKQLVNYNKLSDDISLLMIYSYKYDDDLSTLPHNLKKIMIYNGCHFYESVKKNFNTEAKISYFDKLNKENIDKIKVPFGCELYVNNELC
jgi:hypothetical protein